MNVQTKKLSACDDRKTDCCADCGGLECLCRPRFFAGQLLTEETLNLLDRYMRTRFRMHNLSLHGTGVVNGMKVICEPCGEITVTTGHAISPCGDDIILCGDVAVPICDLIRKCRQSERKSHDCDPPRRDAQGCEDLEEEWVLAIKYDESSSRGVMPLRGSGSCSSGTCGTCGCGGSTCDCTDCGCDACCQGSKAKQAPRPRTAPQSCEPTVICEGYRFCVYRKPDKDPKDDDGFRLIDRDSELVRQMQCCIEVLTGAVPVMPDVDEAGQLTPANRNAMHTFCCRFRQSLLDYFARHAHTNCELARQVSQLTCPSTDRDDFAQVWTQTILVLLFAWIDAIKQCFCLALLPPAPRPGCEDRVSLATVKVRARDCTVLSVCNWTTHRDMLVSWPSVTYWLGAIGIWDMLRDLLDRICCSSLTRMVRDVQFGGQEFAGGDTAMFRMTATEQPQPEPTGEASFTSLSKGLDSGFAAFSANMLRFDMAPSLKSFAFEVAGNWNDTAGLSKVLDATSSRFNLARGGRALGQGERDNLPELLAIEMVAKPVLSGMLGLAGKSGKEAMTTMRKNAAKAEEASEISRLREEVEAQRADIALLKRALAKMED